MKVKMSNVVTVLFVVTLGVASYFSMTPLIWQQECNVWIDAKRDTVADINKNLSPYFIVLTDKGASAYLPLKSTSVDVKIAGVIADVTVKQVYKNTGKNTIEAIYVFPASTRAAVYNMVMTVNDRVIKAVVEEKEEARDIYESAKSEGKTASLLEEERPNVFKMNIANIIPGATVKVEMSYTELLVPTDNTYEFVYPTVVGPRYVSKTEYERDSVVTFASNPYIEQGIKPTSKLAINLNIATGIPIKGIKCETHKHKLHYINQSSAILEMVEPQGGNRDFVVQYSLAGNVIESGVLLYQDANGEKFFLAIVQPPARIEPQMVAPREFVFIMDVSGSMEGFPHEISKQVMSELLQELKETDLFNIVLFAGESNVFSTVSLPATAKNKSKANEFLKSSYNGGGTELMSALETAMSLNENANFSRSFVILTDGYVMVEKETFDYIRNHMGRANFFAFGIGSSVNRLLIEGIAHVGSGEPFFILDERDSTKQVDKFIKYVSRPLLAGVECRFSNLDVYDVLPEKIPDLFADRPLVVTGKYKGNASGFVSMTGKNGDKQFSRNMMIDSDCRSTGKALKYLWAREKVRLLADYNNLDGDSSTKAQIVGLGKKYNLLTEFTSFVAIDSVVSNFSGRSTVVKQPLPLPQGVSNYAVGAPRYTIKFTPPVIKPDEGVADKADETENIASPIANADYNKSFDEEEVPVTTPDAVVEDTMQVVLVAEQMPEFPGGKTALDKFLAENLQYPQEAQQKGIQCTVYLRFVVDPFGKIVNVSIVKKVDPLLDAEAIRVVESMPIWQPGKQHGQSVAVSCTLPIVFSL